MFFVPVGESVKRSYMIITHYFPKPQYIICNVCTPNDENDKLDFFLLLINY